jgi:hypothetical protein
VVFPSGMIGYIYEPISGRENDIGALNMSQLNQHMIDCQDEVTQGREQGEQLLYYSFYGDGIFPFLYCITRRQRAPIGGQLTVRQIVKDTAMLQLGTYAEWPYETVTYLFHILHCKYSKHFLCHNRTVNDIIHKQHRVVFFSLQLLRLLQGK